MKFPFKTELVWHPIAEPTLDQGPFAFLKADGRIVSSTLAEGAIAWAAIPKIPELDLFEKWWEQRTSYYGSNDGEYRAIQGTCVRRDAAREIWVSALESKNP